MMMMIIASILNHCYVYYPFIARSLEWVCPSCGVANRTALPEGSEEEARDTKEMEDIVSQMANKVYHHTCTMYNVNMQ